MVLVGLEIGVFTQAIFNGTLIMIFGSCVIAGFYYRTLWQGPCPKFANQRNTGDIPQRLLVPLANPATADAIMALTLLLRDREALNRFLP